MPSTLLLRIVEVIVVVTLVEVNLGNKIPATIFLAIVEFIIFGVDGRCGNRSQMNSHSSSCNHGAIVDVEWRGGYKSQNSHFSSHNPGDRDRLLTSLVSYNTVNGKFHGKREVDVVVMDMIRVISIIMIAMGGER